MIDREIHLARALLIEGNALLRSVTAAQLKNLGVGQVSHATRLKEARLTLERESFDIVVCSREFDDSDHSGQDLLDELRREQLLPHSTVFLMVTAQAAYHQVVEAAEASLDGLLVRPFTAAALGDRLAEARNRKRALADVLRALDAGEFETAFVHALKRFQDKQPYWAWCGRLAAELLLRLQRPADARKVFDRLVTTHGAAWSRLGVARAQMATSDMAGARGSIGVVLAEEPDCADAHDLLARTLVEQSDFDGALDAYRRAATITPGCLLRAQHVGALAFYQGREDEALAALERSVTLGTQSKLFDAQTLLLLAMLRFDQGNVHGVAAMLEQLQKYAQRFPASKRLRRMEAAVKALGLLLGDGSSRSLDIARRLGGEVNEPAFDLEAANVTLALWARLPHTLRPPGEHDALIDRCAQRFCVSKAIAEVLCAAARRDPSAVSAIRRCQAQLTEIAETAMARSLKGDHRGAVAQLLEAGEAAHNAKLLEMGGALARRHAAAIEGAEDLCARAAELTRRWGHHSTHIAGIQRSGRSPSGLQIRTVAPAPRAVAAA